MLIRRPGYVAGLVIILSLGYVDPTYNRPAVSRYTAEHMNICPTNGEQFQRAYHSFKSDNSAKGALGKALTLVQCLLNRP